MKIRLTLRKFDFQDFKRGIEMSAKRISLSSQQQIFDIIVKLHASMKGQRSMTRWSLTRMLRDFGSMDKCLDEMNDPYRRIACYGLQVFCEILGVSADHYSVIFRGLNYKKGVRPKRKLMAYAKWSQLRKDFDELIELLPEIDAESDVRIIAAYREAVVAVLYLWLPARQSDDYRTMRNADDGASNYYDGENRKLVYRGKHGSDQMRVKVDVPVQYRGLFDRYHRMSSKLSEYFLCTNRSHEMFRSQNYSNMGKRLFGVELQSIRNKWRNIIEVCGDENIKRRLIREFGAIEYVA